MKLYTDESQIAKLIELGFEKPKNERWVLDVANESTPSIQNIVKCQDYSIGELIEMLPEFASQRLRYVATKRAWIVDIDVLGKQGRCHRGVYYIELIDALYDMIIMLKEEGVI